MKVVCKISLFTGMLLFASSPAFSAPSYVICKNNKSGAIVVKTKCSSSETKLTASTLSSPTIVTGPMGSQGIQGLKGDIGPTGETGAVGPQGLTGAIGPIGPQGAAGIQGTQGATGPQGLQGPRGLSALDTIPSGTTVRGWINQSYYTAHNAEIGILASGQLPASAPEPFEILIANHPLISTGDVFVSPNELDLGVKCTGTAEAPTAAANTLCVYIINTYTDKLSTISPFSNNKSLYGFSILLQKDPVPNGIITTTIYTALEAAWAYRAP